jgi:hypothetical protein
MGLRVNARTLGERTFPAATPSGILTPSISSMCIPLRDLQTNGPLDASNSMR